MKVIYTVGHSNRPIEVFISLLKKYRISLLIDVRRFPSSRKYPWFQKEYLSSQLSLKDIEYVWLGNLLGGYRTGGYTDYMSSDEYNMGINKIIELAEETYVVAIMCSEKLWFRCHRRYISDTLRERGYRVMHILDDEKVYEHGRRH
jgi:uncharacterized protein (DUF488 family)